MANASSAIMFWTSDDSRSTMTAGRKTIAVVTEAATMARPVRRMPPAAASSGFLPRSRRRWTDSKTTTLLSTMSPMPTARPKSVKRLSDRPAT